jgi:hypothetical protein
MVAGAVPEERTDHAVAVAELRVARSRTRFSDNAPALGDALRFEPRGLLEVKGKGSMETFFIYLR